MTPNTDIVQRPAAGLAPAQVTQATAVEQARAVAEVQAAVTVARNCPRDIGRVEAEVRSLCSRLPVAERAFYAVDNRGSGASVHLARELARIYGNLDYGVRELRRDDDAGESEVEAFAWDQEQNVRTRRSFQVPHARMKGRGVNRGRVRLIDLQDIYLNNQNIGARAVRECIYAILPDWLKALAEDLCRATLARGDGKPLAERIETMLGKFNKLDIAEGQVETRTGKRRSQWTVEDIGRLVIDYQSITSDGIDPDSIFPSDTLGTLQAQALPTTAQREPVDQEWPDVAQPGSGPQP